VQQQQQHLDSQANNAQSVGQSATNIDGEVSNKRNNNRRRPRRRGRGGGRGNDVAAGDSMGSSTNATNGNGVSESNTESPPSPRTEQAMTFIADSIAGSNGASANTANGSVADSNNANQTPKQRSRNRKKGKNRGNTPTTNSETNPGDAQQQQQQQQPADAEKKKKKRSRNRIRKKNNNKAWRQFVPSGLEDPISLQPLADLPYPPFAVVVDPPYVAILPGMWPPPEPTALHTSSDGADAAVGESNKNLPTTKPTTASVDEKDRELTILKAQWGDGVAVHSSKEGDPKTTGAEPTTTSPSSADIQNRHLNLFDGRVLAYYLVSTLQFIDPLNRRDLTRPELVALDAYLAHHSLGNAGVTEAYDAKGITVSTAGSAAQSATGRAQILQEEARAIMGSFQIGGGSQQQQQQQQQQPSRQQRERRNVRHVQSMGNLSEGTNSFQRMYAAQEGNRHGSGALPASSSNAPMLHDTGIYEGDGGGLLVIDDDINPGLRSGMPPGESHSDANAGGFYSARHIAERHSQEAQVREGNFPSLSGAAPASATADNVAATKPPLPPAGGPSKSLSKISKLVKKTDRKEVERQRKAREDAQRRAEMSKLSFFNPDMPVPAGSMMANNNLPAAGAPMVKMPPSEAVIERNRNLAMALGVAPSTIRNIEQNLTTGWARPVGSNEFGNELLDNAAQYPDSLLSEAKERMTELLKLEKQWKKFLSDDRSPGYSLKAMERPLRKFVHEYSDFWRLKTESFDPEGRRYVHCSKLVDTSAPYPLLSEAARKWRGPAAGPAVAGVVDMTMIPTGPSLKPSVGLPLSNAVVPSSTDGWRTEQRVPLKLVPRTTAIVAEIGIGTAKPPLHYPSIPSSAIGGGMTRSTSTPLLSMTNERPPPPRFAALCDKERPRLQLAKRSIPTWDELEKRRISQEEWNGMTPDQQEAILCEIEEEDERNMAKAKREKEKEDARLLRLENKAKKQHALQEKQRAMLESAFASDDDGSSGSDWFEGDLEFDGSDDEGM